MMLTACHSGAESSTDKAYTTFCDDANLALAEINTEINDLAAAPNEGQVFDVYLREMQENKGAAITDGISPEDASAAISLLSLHRDEIKRGQGWFVSAIAARSALTTAANGCP